MFKGLRKWCRSFPPLGFWSATLLFAAILAFFFVRIWIVIVTGGYIVPRDADDWAAWGTWVGGLATAAAFIYTLAQLRKQRTQEIARDTRELERHRALARLVRLDPPQIEEGKFFGHQTRGSAKDDLFDGKEYTFNIRNDGPHSISDLTICFDGTCAAPPRESKKPPLISDPSNPAHNISPKIHKLVGNVRYPFTLQSEVEVTNVSKLALEVLPPGGDESFTVVFTSEENHDMPHWISFTDASGYKWYRNCRTGDITLDSESTTKDLTSHQN